MIEVQDLIRRFGSVEAVKGRRSSSKSVRQSQFKSQAQAEVTQRRLSQSVFPPNDSHRLWSLLRSTASRCGPQKTFYRTGI